MCVCVCVYMCVCVCVNVWRLLGAAASLNGGCFAATMGPCIVDLRPIKIG